MQTAGAGPRAKAQRLSLSQPKRTTIKLTTSASSASPQISGVTVDNESLRRQREEMSQALGRSQRPSSRGVATATPAASSKAPSLPRSLSSVEPNDVSMTGMNGTTTVPSGQMQYPRSLSGQLPTPAMNGVPPTLTTAPHVNGNYQASSSFTSSASRNAFSVSDNPMDRKYRDPGKGEFCEVHYVGAVLTLFRP